jgi:hypothetical protein
LSTARRLLSLGAAALLVVACEHASSTPTAVVTPPPAPAPEPTPVKIFGCGLPRGAGDGRRCFRESPSFQGEINDAIEKVIAEHPEYFDFGTDRGVPRDFRVLDVPRYVDEVVYNLRSAGFCAFNDGEEIGLKNSNDFSDQYDIITGHGYILRGYTVTCYPAWSAIPPAGDDS